jgi:hypothetical protein
MCDSPGALENYADPPLPWQGLVKYRNPSSSTMVIYIRLCSWFGTFYIKPDPGDDFINTESHRLVTFISFCDFTTLFRFLEARPNLLIYND